MLNIDKNKGIICASRSKPSVGIQSDSQSRAEFLKDVNERKFWNALCWLLFENCSPMPCLAFLFGVAFSSFIRFVCCCKFALQLSLQCFVWSESVDSNGGKTSFSASQQQPYSQPHTLLEQISWFYAYCMIRVLMGFVARFGSRFLMHTERCRVFVRIHVL